MSTIQIAPTAASAVTDETLKHGPERLLTFLQGLSDPVIRVLFASLGWSETRSDEAWSLLSELKAVNAIPVAVADPVGDAIASCEAWQATGLVRTRAMMQITFPEQAAFVFHDFIPGAGTAAVLNVATFLERRQLLEKGADRKATRKADHEALAVLDEVGTTKEVLEQLQAFVDTAQSGEPADLERLTTVEAKRSEVLRKIHAWLTGWSEMARTVITRRDHLIKLGIAKRRARKSAAATPPTAPAMPATPATPAIPAPPATPATPAIPATPVVIAAPATPATPAAPTPPVIAATPATPATPAAPPAAPTAPQLEEHAPESRAA